MVAFYLPGGVAVYTYSLLLGLGMAVGLAWIAWQAPRNRALPRVNAGIWVSLGALIGGRVGYTLMQWPYFQSHLWETWQISRGGLAWPGALAGGCLALLITARLSRQPLGKLADALLPLASTLTIAAWLGCWVEGSAYGPLASGWWGIPTRDEWGQVLARFPTQFVGASLALITFWLLDLGWFPHLAERGASPPGWVTCLGLFGLSLQLLALSFVRADPAPHWLGLRLDTWAALAFSLIFCLAGLNLYLRARQAAALEGPLA